MTIKEAIALLTANGYRVSRPRGPAPPVRTLNAIGKPYSANFDPNYRIKHKTPRPPYAPSTAAHFARAKEVYISWATEKYGDTQPHLLKEIFKRQSIDVCRNDFC